MQNDKFAPKSHFFTDPAAIAQVAAQAFGPQSATLFNLTSGFTVAGTPNAYAICTGIVLIQPQAGSSTKVNLVLRPFRQPIQGINVKYFVYRGLNKADFFTGVNIKATSGSSSQFINKINESFAAFHTHMAPADPVPAFLAKYIGYDPAQADALPLSDFFFKQTEYVENNGEFLEDDEAAFELPMIEYGKSLGTFASGTCGIDVVLNYGDYKQPAPNEEFVFDLAYARAVAATLNVSTGTDTAKKIRKEQMSQFLDIAAYYGFHHTDKGSVTIDNAGAKVNKTGEEICTDVIQNFFTKNWLYLYIQSDRGRSYNFYGNYDISDTNSNSLKTGQTEGTLTEQVYGTDGWPLLIDKATQVHNNARNALILQLVTDNNVNTMFYGQVAEVVNAQKNNFLNTNDLILPPDVNGDPAKFTAFIALSNPATGPANAKLNVANFNIVLYQGRTYSYVAGQFTDDQNVTTDILAHPNFFDDVFGQLTAASLLQASSNTDYSSLSFQRLKLINQYFDRQQQGISAVQTLMVNDVIETGIPATPTVQRVSYITESVDVLNTPVSVTGSSTSDSKSTGSVAGSVSGTNTYQLPEPFYYELKLFTDSTETITGLELKATDGSVPNKIILGLTKTENDLLKALISANTLTNACLFLVDLFEDGNELISAENILYQKYKAGIVGEQADGELKLFMPATDVMVYSLDRLFHFTKGYSEYVVVENVDYLTIERSL